MRADHNAESRHFDASPRRGELLGGGPCNASTFSQLACRRALIFGSIQIGALVQQGMHNRARLAVVLGEHAMACRSASVVSSGQIDTNRKQHQHTVGRVGETGEMQRVDRPLSNWSTSTPATMIQRKFDDAQIERRSAHRWHRVCFAHQRPLERRAQETRTSQRCRIVARQCDMASCQRHSQHSRCANRQRPLYGPIVAGRRARSLQLRVTAFRRHPLARLIRST
jgi:hypothetical protein